MEIIAFIFNVIIGIIFRLIQLVLYPIDILLQTIFPDVSNALTNVGDFLTLVASGLGWAISASGLTTAALALIAAYFAIKLTLPLNLWFVKLALKWYHVLKK